MNDSQHKMSLSDADIASSVASAVAAAPNRLRARSVAYVVETNHVEIIMENGISVSWPKSAIHEFRDVEPECMNAIALSPRGTAIELHACDVDIDIGGLLADLVINGGRTAGHMD